MIKKSSFSIILKSVKIGIRGLNFLYFLAEISSWLQQTDFLFKMALRFLGRIYFEFFGPEFFFKLAKKACNMLWPNVWGAFNIWIISARWGARNAPGCGTFNLTHSFISYKQSCTYHAQTKNALKYFPRMEHKYILIVISNINFEKF